jgi:hypothetical protein
MMTTPHRPTFQSPASTFNRKIDGMDCPLIHPSAHKEEEEERNGEEVIKKKDQEKDKETPDGEADIEATFSFVIVGSKDEDGKPWSHWQPPNHVSPVNAPRFSVASLLERIAMKN